MFKCQICKDNPSHSRQFQLKGYWISDCNHCKHRFAEIESTPEHVEEVYSDEYFFGGKAGYPDYLKEKELLIQRGEWYGKLLKKYLPAGNVLDIGAAAGFVLEGMLREGWKGEGVEPNDRMAAHARERGVQVHSSPIEDVALDNTFDLVTMIQVLPHFYDLNAGLDKIDSFTRPGGYWLIETWNKDSLTAKMMGESWHEYIPPSVLHWFSPNTIQHFAKQWGFSFVAQGRPPKKLKADHAKSLIRHKFEGKFVGRLIEPGLKIIPDALTIPYPAEDLFWMLLQKAK